MNPATGLRTALVAKSSEKSVGTASPLGPRHTSSTRLYVGDCLTPNS